MMESPIEQKKKMVSTAYIWKATRRYSFCERHYDAAYPLSY